MIKKTLVGLTVAVLACGLAACGEKKADAKKTPTPEKKGE